MSAVKAIASTPAALLLLAGPAGAVTVKNTSGKEITIGINYGSQGRQGSCGQVAELRL